jgi:endonuclease III
MARTTRATAAKLNSNASLVEPQQLSSPPATPKPKAKATRGKKASATTIQPLPSPGLAVASKKRTRKAVKQEEGDVNELPHNLAVLPSPGADEIEEDEQEPPAKRVKQEVPETPMKSKDAVQATPAKKTPKKANYGLTPGMSPFPDYARPTPEECREVVRLLEKQHGKVNAPKTIPPPSLDSSGCGEVPSVLDALIRTRLSANTTNKNSSTAFQGLVKRFGTLKEGIGKGSVDWDAVRRAPNQDVFKAIERGGLAKIKSKDIQSILQMVYEENQERKSALKDERGPEGVENESKSEQQEEISKAEKNIISLDHLHLLSTNDAINRMLTYPGIGPKTASCVALFCLQRPSFAVDTHVFRLCQYLGWVPKTTKKGQPKVDRNTTYSHCDVRIPDEFKYPLHQLLIKHGKVCPRCRAATGQSSADWEDGCPIEHLVKRHGAKKGGISGVDRHKAKAAAGPRADEDAEIVAEASDEDSELSEEDAAE